MNPDLPGLEQRFGRHRLAERLKKQRGKTARLLHQGEGLLRIERIAPLDAIVMTFLQVSGLAGAARKGFLDVHLTEQTWRLRRLDPAFDGFRLLQLTDLHLDLDPALTDVILHRVGETPHNAAVITGDFRNSTSGDFESCVRETTRVLGALSPNRWGILGNHDFIEMAPALERAGLPMLLNEAACVERNGARLWFVGIDDPHFYKTHDLVEARANIPGNDCRILLAHSPEVYVEAGGHFDLQLSGHTHAGQLCLPGGRPVIVPCKVPGPFVRGRWRHGRLQGYTSPGTGSCGVAARLNCPPEITLHTLRCGGPDSPA